MATPTPGPRDPGLARCADRSGPPPARARGAGPGGAPARPAGELMLPEMSLTRDEGAGFELWPARPPRAMSTRGAPRSRIGAPPARAAPVERRARHGAEEPPGRTGTSLAEEMRTAPFAVSPRRRLRLGARPRSGWSGTERRPPPCASRDPRRRAVGSLQRGASAASASSHRLSRPCRAKAGSRHVSRKRSSAARQRGSGAACSERITSSARR